ncbi:hypothetical protein BJF93_11385 [Xaviernesmea oryzae]|uniref:Uncharacterized protein n=1 Tax=Xaviernesmea oryzae TaxID=464029 RepID=A0A1Q9AW73_9HYPH|nr:hypothetical protein [Xaviernesmea oryzae]OLP59663.1 hypothetical protein BJF93_11385 [Xaviernesmea oryzae]SEM23661.1 hypothetical protein SAMN04487976_1245 [Xaviernesmea oryzae]
MSKGSGSSEPKKKWWQESLSEQLVDSRAILPREGHERIKILAEQIGERVPILLGKFVMASLSMFDRGKADLEMPPKSETGFDMARRSATTVLLDSDVFEICSAIVSSRFPEDTGAARMRQAAMVVTVATEIAAGRKPTATSLAQITGNQASSLVMLSSLLEDRGILRKVQTAGVGVGRSAKVFEIRPDAVDAINAAHLAQTGASIIRADMAAR